MADIRTELDNKTIGRYPPRTSDANTKKSWADSYNYGGLGGVFTSGGVGRNQDIAPTRWGAANAYRIVPPIHRAVNLRADAIDSLPWSIIRNETNDPKNDVTVARSTDNHPRHPFALAIQRMWRRQKKSFMGSLESDKLIYGEIFIELLRVSDDYGNERVTGVNWLNPLGVYVDTRYGDITGYRYSDLSDGQYIYLLPRDVAYMHTYHPMDDHRGLGQVSVVVDKVNVYRNTSRYIEAFFRNNALPGGVVRPKDDNAHWSDTERNTVKNEFRRNFQGTDNAFAFMVAPVPMEIEKFDQPDIEKQYSLNDPVRREIYEEFGIPLPMAGDTNGTSYQNQDAVLTWFYQNTIIPSAQSHQEYINAEILPRFPDSDYCRLEFDTTAFDLVSADDQVRSTVANANYSSGVWNKNEARVYTKVDPVPDGDVFAEPKQTPQPPQSPIEISNLDASEPAGETPQTQAANQLIDSKKPELPAPTIPGKATQVNAEDELRAWERKVSKNAKAAFEPTHLRGDLGDWITQSLTDLPADASVKTVFETARERLAVKAIQATRLEFESEFADLLARVQTDRADRRTFSATLRYFLNKFGRKAYLDGLNDGGVDTDELDDEDRGEIAELLADQSQYVTEFGNTLFKGDGITDWEAVNKPNLWWNKSIQPFYQAGLISADKNGLYEWVYGDTEHCDSCLQLNGQRHRLRDYKRKGLMPQSGDLDCGGWNCKCKLVKATGKAKGSWVKAFNMKADEPDKKPFRTDRFTFEGYDIQNPDSNDEQKKYDPSQQRDDSGQWTDGGGASGGDKQPDTKSK